MVTKDDFLRAIPTGMLRVASRNDSHQSQYDQKKKKKEPKIQESSEENQETEELDFRELIEFGRIVFHKRNTELKLFSKLRNLNLLNEIKAAELKKQDNNSNVQNETPDSTIPHETSILKIKIAGFNKDLQEIKLKTKEQTHTPQEHEDKIVLQNLSKLLELYSSFLISVKKENTIINIDDIDHFEVFIKEKDDILDQIEAVQREIDFEAFKDYPPDDENKIMANQILADIHDTINKIILQENQNNIELQNLKDKIKLDISKQDKGAKAVSQYGKSSIQSHFIDKKT